MLPKTSNTRHIKRGPHCDRRKQPTIAEFALLDVVSLQAKGQAKAETIAAQIATGFDDGEELGIPWWLFPYLQDRLDLLKGVDT